MAKSNLVIVESPSKAVESCSGSCATCGACGSQGAAGLDGHGGADLSAGTQDHQIALELGNIPDQVITGLGHNLEEGVLVENHSVVLL